MSNLANLLNDMATDAALQTKWKQDKEAVMDSYNLTDEERQALRNADVDAIKQLSGITNVHSNSTIKAYDG